jgi:hypothetical protein
MLRLMLTRLPHLGRIESTYEPAMTKAFRRGRTESIRTVQPNSVAFTKVRIARRHSPLLSVTDLFFCA